MISRRSPGWGWLDPSKPGQAEDALRSAGKVASGKSIPVPSRRTRKVGVPLVLLSDSSEAKGAVHPTGRLILTTRESWSRPTRTQIISSIRLTARFVHSNPSIQPVLLPGSGSMRKISPCGEPRDIKNSQIRDFPCKELVTAANYPSNPPEVIRRRALIDRRLHALYHVHDNCHLPV
jgi:hypothetical protein